MLTIYNRGGAKVGDSSYRGVRFSSEGGKYPATASIYTASDEYSITSFFVVHYPSNLVTPAVAHVLKQTADIRRCVKFVEQISERPTADKRRRFQLFRAVEYTLSAEMDTGWVNPCTG